MIPVRALASSVSFLREEHVMGHVHSVFATSFNIEFSGRIVHVGAAGEPFSCIGFTLDAGELARLLPRLKAGYVAAVQEGILRIYTLDGVVELDLNAAAVVDCACPQIEVEDANWIFIQLSGQGVAEKSGLAGDATATAAVTVLACADWRGEEGTRALDTLIGRGPGLTPSGDDFLLGYALALKACGSDDDLAAHIVRASRGRTTDVSLAYIEALAAGWVNPVWIDLTQAVRERRLVDFDRCVQVMVGIGHTSGWDALFGCAVGFRRARARAFVPASTLASSE